MSVVCTPVVGARVDEIVRKDESLDRTISAFARNWWHLRLSQLSRWYQAQCRNHSGRGSRPCTNLQLSPLRYVPALLRNWVVMPTASSTDLVAAARDLVNALQHPLPISPLSPTSDSRVAALN
jgi:hypothetical protein